ncbi:MAG TPA: response regulator transcription factor [Oculatellaceae cyanobacterium]
MSDDKLTIYVLADKTAPRAALTKIINASGSAVIVGENDNGEQAVGDILSMKPDVVLIDLALPSMSGTQVLKLLKTQWSDAKAIMLSGTENSSMMFEALVAGAVAYMNKSDLNAEKVMKAIHDVHSGASWLDPSIARDMLKAVAVQDPSLLEGLTDPQKKLLVMVADESMAQAESSEKSPALAGVESDMLRKIESNGPTGDWTSFINRLEKFKQ